MTPGFRDHFASAATDYAAFRPRYPAALFAALAECAPGRHLAWDCATGSGQAAIGLAEHFEQVVATDASAAQLSAALAHARVRYREAPADAFLGTQGDVWDTQWDMFMALVGAITAQILIARRHDRALAGLRTP